MKEKMGRRAGWEEKNGRSGCMNSVEEQIRRTGSKMGMENQVEERYGIAG